MDRKEADKKKDKIEKMKKQEKSLFKVEKAKKDERKEKERKEKQKEDRLKEEKIKAGVQNLSKAMLFMKGGEGNVLVVFSNNSYSLNIFKSPNV